MAISTFKVYLMVESGSPAAWTKLVDIKDFPNLGGTPELLETTTLSDEMQTFILGIQQLDSLEFTANYTKSDFTTLKSLEGTSKKYAVWFGASVSNSVYTPDGSDGKFDIEGALSVFPSGGGVNEVVDMTITIAASKPIKFS